MIEHDFPAKLIRLIRVTLDGLESSVRVVDDVSSSFATLHVLKQGDALSNFLFNRALEGAIRKADVQMSGSIVKRSHKLLGLVDDIDIIRIDCRAVEDAFIF